MVSPVPFYVIDASVTGRWHLRDEPLFQAQCDLVLQRYVAGQLDLMAPDCLIYEFASIVAGAVRENRVSIAQARQVLRDFEAWQIPMMPTESLAARAIELSALYDHPIYDCYYMALAESTRHPYIHADEKLHRKLSGRFPFELWVGNYA
jgi:predicted nucleic acid-binding protein